MYLFFLLFLCVFALFYNFVWKRRNLPPGPIPLPLIGNVLTLKRLAPGYAAFQQWTKQYGPVFTFWLAEDPIVAVTDFSIIKETFIKDGNAYAGRDFYNSSFEIIKASRGTTGVGKTEGEEWLQLRRFSLKLMRNLGMGSNLMEQKIMLEVDSVIDSIILDLNNNDECAKDYHLSPLIDVAVGSVINQFTFGFRFIGEFRKEFDEMKSLMDEQMQGFVHSITSIVLAMPTLRYLPVFSYYFQLFEKRVTRLYAFFDRQIEKTISKRKEEKISGSYKYEEDTYFIDAFMHEIEQRRAHSQDDKEDKIFNLQALRGTCPDLFFAGQETTSNTIKFLVLYMIVFPEVQTKMQKELDRVIGDNKDGSKRICVADKAKLPYTNAVIHETQRFCNLLPMNLLHRTTKDVECGGFKIAKNTKIVPVISCVLYDERIFPEPHKFIPERFIQDGQLKKYEEFIPFSVGKRQCMAESMSKMELFLFTANLFFFFNISAIDDQNTPTLEKRTGLAVSPTDYRCCIQKRKQKLIH